MRPIKPKKLSKAYEEWLQRAGDSGSGVQLGAVEVRAILAALEYERQRADEAEKRASAAALEVDKCRSERSIYKPQHWHD